MTPELFSRKLSDLVQHASTMARGFFSRGRLLSSVAILLGGILLGYVGVQYGRMYKEQHDLAVRWSELQQARTQVVAHSDDSEVLDDDLTRLSVPRIELNSFVVEGTSYRDLLLGPGHMPHTPYPGSAGNSVITGHRDTFFRHISELEKGDTVLIQRGGKTYRFEVVGKKIVQPTDVSVLDPTSDSELTLITCYPTYYIGPAPKRLVVSSRLIGEENGLNGSAPQAQQAGPPGHGGAN